MAKTGKGLYQAVAMVLHDYAVPNAQSPEQHSQHCTMKVIAGRLANIFESTNPAFDRQRFMDAVETGNATAESCGRDKDDDCKWRRCRMHKNGGAR